MADIQFNRSMFLLLFPFTLLIFVIAYFSLSSLFPFTTDFSILKQFTQSFQNQSELVNLLKTAAENAASSSNSKFLKALDSIEHEFEELQTSMEFLEDSMNNILSMGKLFRTEHKKRRAPISLLYPCGERDIPRIYQILESISQQTVMPNETIIVVSIKENVAKPLNWEFFGTYGIPNLRIYVRGGYQTAGSNRQFLIDSANSDIMSFCDCDDYIAPQRTEILDRLFMKFPEIEAMIHTFKTLHRTKEDSYNASELAEHPISQDEIESWVLPFNFLDVWNHKSIANFTKKSWVIDDPNTEPNHPNSLLPVWWFPSGFPYRWRNQPHNAWITIRSKTAHEIPYPNLSQGEDSLYNWRLLKSHRNWTCLDMPLGGYVRPTLLNSFPFVFLFKL